MKRARNILVLLFGLFFFSKSLVTYAADPMRWASYAVELADKEPVKGGDKDAQDGKEKTEDWIVNYAAPVFQSEATRLLFGCYSERSFIGPYSEISSPPPELHYLS